MIPSRPRDHGAAVFILFGAFFCTVGVVVLLSENVFQPRFHVTPALVTGPALASNPGPEAGADGREPSAAERHFEVEYLQAGVLHKAILPAVPIEDLPEPGTPVMIYFERQNPKQPYWYSAPARKQLWLERLMPLVFVVMGLVLILVGRHEMAADQRARDKLRAFLVAHVAEIEARNPARRFEPFEYTDRPSWGMGLIQTGLGLFIIGFCALAVWTEWRAGRANTLLVLLTGSLALFGAGLAYFGMKELYRVRVEISTDMIACTKTALLGKGYWEEPLENYLGIRQDCVDIRSRGSVRREFVYSLIHRDEHAKDVAVGMHALANLDILTRDGSERGAWEALSKRLGRPMIDEDAQGGFALRHSADTDKSAGQMLAEGHRRRTKFSRQPFPGKSVRLRVLPGHWIASQHYALSAWIGLALLALGGGAARGFQVYELLIPTGLMGLIFIGISFFGMRLVVTREEVAGSLMFFGKRMNEKRIPWTEVEEIKLVQDRQTNSTVLAIVSDRHAIHFGHGAAKEELEWLEDRLLRQAEKNTAHPDHKKKK